MVINRRQFIALLPFAAVAACSQSPTTPTPKSEPIPLLQLLKATGYNAEARTSGAGKLIAINGSTSWNIKIGDTFIGLGASNRPNLDVTAVLVDPAANWSVVRV